MVGLLRRDACFSWLAFNDRNVLSG